MKSTPEILNILKQSRHDLELLGVKRIGVYGSYARNEQNKDSDIDILLELDYDQFSFNRFNEACDLIDELFEGEKVSIVTKAGLNTALAPRILNEAIYA